MITQKELEDIEFHRVAIYRDGGTEDYQYKNSNLILKYRGNNRFRKSDEITLRYISKEMKFIDIFSETLENIEELKDLFYKTKDSLKEFIENVQKLADS